MKRLLKYLSKYKAECVLAPLFKMLEATFELFVPLVMAAIIDRGIATGDLSYIGKMCLLLVLLAVIGLISAVTAQYFAAKAAVGFATNLRHAVFKHIQGLSYSELDSIGSSTLITRMTSDINQAQSGVNMTLRLFLRSPFIVFGAMIMAFTVNAKEALIFAATIPALSVVVFGIMVITMPMYKKVQAELDGILNRTVENLEGARVIRAFRKEKEETEHFNEETDSLADMQRLVGRISGLMNPVTFIIVNAATIALLYTGAFQVDKAVITQGELVALVNYMSQILVELVKLANLIITISKALACANRVADVLDIKTGLIDGTAPLPEKKPGIPAVEFSHACLIYGKSTNSEALSDISFKAMPGETIGIIGGTGAGKSSIVNLIPRFYDVSSGTVRVNGADVKSCRMADLRSKIGVVPQKAVLFHGSIAENLRWGNEGASVDELNAALKAAQAYEFVTEKSGGLDFVISEGGKNLSGGQRQRLTIARALVRQPEILILDDSSSALDFATDAALRQAVSSLKNKMTVFIVSQRTSSIMHADKIIVVDNGRITGTGTHEELLKSDVIYREIYESQFKGNQKDE